MAIDRFVHLWLESFVHTALPYGVRKREDTRDRRIEGGHFKAWTLGTKNPITRVHVLLMLYDLTQSFAAGRNHTISKRQSNHYTKGA